MKKLYNTKDDGYFGSDRAEIVQYVPRGSHRMLDVGCGAGVLLSHLVEIGRCSESWGIEFVESAAREAEKVLDKVIVADLEARVPELPRNHFDIIMCLDVLEHLRDPWATLSELCESLTPGGELIVSLPNIRYVEVLKDLVYNGRFAYTEAGVLDRTHLRFFTRESAEQLLEGAGLDEVSVDLHPGSVSGFRGLVNSLTLGVARDIFSWQLIATGRKL